MSDEAKIRALARDLRAVIERYDGPRCVAGCTCPMSQALDAAARFIATAEAFERGEIIPGGLPTPRARRRR